jgi:predicted DNA-binding transcriptional regulator
MIQTDAQLQQAIEQIERLYRGLDALRRDILPKNARNFALLAEGPLHEIHKLQTEIDDYISRLERAAAA